MRLKELNGTSTWTMRFNGKLPYPSVAFYIAGHEDIRQKEEQDFPNFSSPLQVKGEKILPHLNLG